MSWLVSLILDWLWGKLASLAAELRVKEEQQAADQESAEESVRPLKDAQSAAEIDEGIDRAMDHF